METNAFATDLATLRRQLIAQRDELVTRLDAATEEARMRLPEGKNWSALGHVEHLIVTERGRCRPGFGHADEPCE
jgi:hypothetical protein